MHDEIDLLSLLGLAEHKPTKRGKRHEAHAAKDHQTEQHKDHIFAQKEEVDNTTPEKVEAEPLTANQIHVVNGAGNIQYIVVKDENHSVTGKVGGEQSSDVPGEDEPKPEGEEPEDKNNPFGYITIHTAESVAVGSDGEKTIVVSKENCDVDLDEKYIGEELEDEEVCEAKEVYVYNAFNENLNRTYSKDSFPGRLFTCPSQPFHMRFSLMGEMFIENIVKGHK